MRLKRLSITAFQAIRNVDIAIERPIVGIFGANEAGKSSVAEALKFAFLAEATRVDLKKDLPALITEGSKRASIEITTDEFELLVAIDASGKVTDTHAGRDVPQALPYVLDAQRFATMIPDDRRRFLFDLMDVRITPQEIAKRLLARACDAKKVEAIAPLLRAGMEAAAKEAESRARDAKASFKAVSGEQWGKIKGESYKAPLPDFRPEDAVELQGLDKALADLEGDLGAAQKRLGIAEYAVEQRKKYDATLTHLRETAKSFAHHDDLVKRAEKDLADAKEALLDAQRKAGTKPAEATTQLPCPECGAILTDSEDGESLVLWKAPEAVAYDAEAAGKVPTWEKAVRSYEAVLERHKVNLDAADQAAKQLKATEDMDRGKTADPAPIRETCNTLRADITAKRARQAELQKAHAALEAAGERTKKAKAHHVDVLAWSAIADALAPDGIPGELLAEALKPINDRLAQNAVDSGWKQVRIAADMGITADGRAFRLESKSAQWRVSAQIAEAISFLSGLKLLVLDEFDLLDNGEKDEEGNEIPGKPNRRREAIQWLDILASEGDIDTCILLGTLAGVPKDLPDTFQSVWLEKGTVARELETA